MTDAGPGDSEPEDTHRDDDAPRRTVPAGALVIAIMVAAALGVLAVVALTMGASGDRAGEIDDAREAAGRFGERLLTVDQDRLDEWKAGVLSLSTGGFAEEVDEVEESFRRLIAEAELDVRARVTEVFLSPIDDGVASAVVLYDREIRDAGGTRTESDRYLQVRLLRVDGEWLVDNVIDLPFQTAVPGGEPSTPTSAAPGPTPTTEAPPEG